MTPTEQDREQRYHLASCEMYETLRGIFPNDRRLTGKSCSCGLKELITADRKRVALEARLETVMYIDSMLRFENIPLHPVQAESLKQYLRQLEAQQEEV